MVCVLLSSEPLTIGINVQWGKAENLTRFPLEHSFPEPTGTILSANSKSWILFKISANYISNSNLAKQNSVLI